MNSPITYYGDISDVTLILLLLLFCINETEWGPELGGEAREARQLNSKPRSIKRDNAKSKSKCLFSHNPFLKIQSLCKRFGGPFRVTLHWQRKVLLHSLQALQPVGLGPPGPSHRAPVSGGARQALPPRRRRKCDWRSRCHT